MDFNEMAHKLFEESESSEEFIEGVFELIRNKSPEEFQQDVITGLELSLGELAEVLMHIQKITRVVPENDSGELICMVGHVFRAMFSSGQLLFHQYARAGEIEKARNEAKDMANAFLKCIQANIPIADDLGQRILDSMGPGNPNEKGH